MRPQAVQQRLVRDGVHGLVVVAESVAAHHCSMRPGVGGGKSEGDSALVVDSYRADASGAGDAGRRGGEEEMVTSRGTRA